MRKLFYGLIFFALAGSASAYTITADSVMVHIGVLASDSLEGRGVGEPGEMKAATYIAGIFQQLGLKPAGDSGSYLQAFDFVKEVKPGPANKLTINGAELKLGEEFSPMTQSANASFSFDEVIPVDYGIISDDSSYNDYQGKNVEGKAVLIKRFAPADSINPHVDFDKYSSFTDKINVAVSQKAAAIFFITPSDKDDTIQGMGVTHVTAKSIPIVYLRRAALQKLGLDLDSPNILATTGEMELIRVRDTGYNVIGLLAGRTDTAVIIGAHYDHLGWGGSASRDMSGQKAIHHGADDNASGTSGLLELARHFSANTASLHHSILFTAYSGEESGILGSSHFAKTMSYAPGQIRMMANMDMIGRLKEQESGLAVFGTGTAAEFKTYFDSLKVDSLKIAFREPGTGPSDHTAFYNSGIPVLHFFTGAHEDYHKPSDTPEKIDAPGIVKVASLLAQIVTYFDQYPGALTFQKTVDPDAGKRMSLYSVTLGIMPDYVAEVKGLKVDGVSPQRPGEKAGIQKGDVILKMGTYPIEDIYGYMSALSKFRKGDSTTVVIERGADTLNLPVQF